MNCAEAEELLGAYALDALPADEAAAMRTHIAGCAEHAAKGAELRGAAQRLPALTDAVDAPVALRARVLAAVAAEAAPAPSQPVSIAARRDNAATSRVNWRSQGSGMWAALAAVLVVAVIGLAAWNISLRGDDSDLDGLPEGATAVARLEGTPGVIGSVIYFGDDDRALLVAEGVPTLDGQTYQAWSIQGDGDPVSLGTMNPAADGHMSGTVSLEGGEGATIAITIEPEGGSEQPTSEPVLSAKL